MRIALTTETFLPKIDSIVNTLCYLLEHLQRRSWETLLFAPSGSVDRVETLVPVLQSRPDLCLALVGDGPARDKLKSLFAGTSTVFTGYLRGTELSQAYASADCFVFPSTTDTFGNVVLEAMASGLPVVAAAAGGPLDQIENGSNGLLFKPHDSADLGKQIDWLFDRPERVRDMGKAGRRHAESRSWSVVFDRLLDDYVAVAGKRRDPRVHDHAVQSRLVRG